MEFDKEQRYYVYAWYVKETNHVFYIGKGTGNRYRVKKRDNPYFMHTINKYDCGSRILYDNLDEETAFKLEKEAISRFRTYRGGLTNVADGGENPPKQMGKRPEEWKNNLSKGLIRSYEEHPERRKEISDRMKRFLKTERGKEFQRRSIESKKTDAFRKRQSIKCRNANRTPEYRERMSKFWKEYFKTNGSYECMIGENNHNAQKVRQLDLNQNFIKEYSTMTEASRETGVSVSKISAVCRGVRKTAGGFIWEFSTDKRIKLSGAKRASSNPKCRKPILQYSKDGTLIAEHESIAEASKSIEKDRANIIACLKGRIKSAYGYVWVYK